jgi:tetratricopeptide (TPR) repeat protein
VLRRAIAPMFVFAFLLAGCPETGEEHLRKAHVFFSNHDLSAAEDHYKRAAELSPKNAAPLEGVGDVYFERGNLREAAVWYRRAIELDPKALNPRHRLAITFAERGEVREAINVLEEALKIDAKNVFALHALGGLYQKLGEPDRAVAMQAAVLAVDPDHRAARFALANLHVDQGRFEEAERELTKLLGDGQKALAEYGFARLAAKRGKLDVAAKHLDTVLALGVTHPRRVLDDDAFAEAWSHPDMQRVRVELERASASTSSVTRRP